MLITVIREGQFSVKALQPSKPVLSFNMIVRVLLVYGPSWILPLIINPVWQRSFDLWFKLMNLAVVCSRQGPCTLY